MSDIPLSVTIDRSGLGLVALELNDNVIYRVAKLLGGQVSFNRTQVESVYTDGSVTTNRHKQMVTETLEVDVLNVHYRSSLQAAMGTLIRALTQDDFVLTVAIGVSPPWSYQCEAADYQTTWDNAHMVQFRGYLAAQIPRQPNALSGQY